ncbi:hypothetical protein [Oryzobacter telluris]|uniref:hypothetical protein n=1 Tax=Oryzobacter telluris TaxID=3149179 RepID=UPI00370D8621
MSDQPDATPPKGEQAGLDAAAAFAHDDALADEMDEESFPGSDPPSTWAGHDRPPPDQP